jgi:hypothetical protein
MAKFRADSLGECGFHGFIRSFKKRGPLSFGCRSSTTAPYSYWDPNGLRTVGSRLPVTSTDVQHSTSQIMTCRCQRFSSNRRPATSASRSRPLGFAIYWISGCSAAKGRILYL